MKIELDGLVYDLDTAHISFRQALAIQKQTGMSIADWEDSLSFSKDDEGKIRNPPPEWMTCVGALYWLMLAQNGEEADPETMDFDWTDFLQAYFAALSAEIARLRAKAAPEPEPDPTSPAAAGAPASPTRSTRTGTTPKPRGRQGGTATGS